MKKILKYILVVLALFASVTLSAHAEFWAKGANSQLYTNGGNGLGNSIINVAGCNGCTPSGTGTVTSITAGTGIILSPNPITTTGTISVAGAVSSLYEYSITVTGSTYNATNRSGSFTSSSASLDTVWAATITDSSTNPASITFGAGNFVTISGLQVGRGNISVVGQGIGVTNIQGQAASTTLNSTPIFQDVPSQSGAARTLTVDALVGDQTLTMSAADAATFAVGDYILLTSNLSIDTEIAGRNQGEIHQLTGVNGATGVLTLGAAGTGSHVYQTMTVANGANVRKLNMYQNVSISGLTFTDLATSRPNTLGVGQTLFEFIVGLNIQNCQFYHLFNSGTQIYQSLNTNIVDNNFKIIQDVTPSANTYYGVQLRGATNGINVVGNTFQQMRHAVTQGAGSGTYLMGTTRDGTISGNASTDTTTAHFDLHQGAEGFTISNNTMTGDDGSANGIQSRSPVTIVGNSIIGIVGTGISIFGNGSGSLISGNDIKGALTGIQLSNGVSKVNIIGNNIRNGGTGMSLNRLSTTVTISIASPAVVSFTAHSIPVGTEVTFGTTGALPTGLSTGTNYYVISAGLTPNSFEVSTTPGGSAVNTTGTQSGVQTVRYYSGSGSVISGNLFTGNSSDAIFMNGQRNVKFNNNTFTENNRSITMSDTDSHSTGLVVTNNSSYGNIASNFPTILGTGTIVSGNNGFGGLSQLVPIGANAIGLSITQNDTTNNPVAASITNAGTGADLLVNGTSTGNIFTGQASGVNKFTVSSAGDLTVVGTTTLATSLTGLLKVTAGVISTATAGTDYLNSVNTNATLTGSGTTGSALGINLANANNWTALQTFTFPALAATTTDALLVTNTTAATNGTQQISPAFHWSGQGFGTTAGTSQDVSFRSLVLPVQSTVPTGTWQLQSSINGGAFGSQLQVTSAGLVSATTGFSALGAAANTAFQSSSTQINSNFATLTTGSNVTTNATMLFGGGSTIAYRAFMNGNTAATPATAIPYGSLIIGTEAVTIPTGTTSLAANLVVNPLAITATGTLTASTSLYINGAATGGTNNYALYVGSGTSLFGGAILNSTGGIGYATGLGAGGTVSQATSKTTPVTLNTYTGTITLNAASLANNTTASFTVTDSAMGANDVATVIHDNTGTVGGYVVGQSNSTAGSFQVNVRNVSGSPLSEAIVLRFVIVKGSVN